LRGIIVFIRKVEIFDVTPLTLPTSSPFEIIKC
jgi:hypothetical protein